MLYFSFTDPVLQYLLSNIQDPKLSSVSASAIESLCMSCFTQMTKYFDVLAQVKNNYCLKLVRQLQFFVFACSYQLLGFYGGLLVERSNF